MTIYKTVIVVFIATILIYFHDIFPKGFGSVGRSSLRVYLYTVGAELRFLLILLLLFFIAKGKPWRFVLLLPILMTTYQLIIRLFVLQHTDFNEFDVKFIITLFISIILTIFYFRSK